MCGRFTIRSIQPVVDMFGFALPPDFPPRYNIAPTEDVPVVRAAAPPAGDDGGGAPGPVGSASLRLDLLHWGLVPPWADDPSVGNRMINARSETAAQRPAFREAMRRRRCLVPADGFYEWKRLGGGTGAKTGKGVRKQPYLFRMKDDRPFAFAGLWDRWRRDGRTLESFTILTTSPNELVSPVHDRMPVIVAPQDYARWLDPARAATDVQDVLRPYDAAAMEAVPVSKHVNSPANDDARCTLKEDAWE